MIHLESDNIRLVQGRAQAHVTARAWFKKHERLIVDLYDLDSLSHPKDHLGWWLFHFQKKLKGQLSFDFTTIGPESVKLKKKDTTLTAADCWFNPEYRFSPVQDLHLVIRDVDNRVVEIETYQLTNDDPTVLKNFYNRLYTTDGYKTVGNTFLETLHYFKLGLLRDIFRIRLGQARLVLDVGSGNSLFTELAPSWPFTLVCCDISEPLIRARTELFPQHHWLVSDVRILPFGQNHFDALFAGEIIEHMPSISDTISEWHRVLKPGGTLILTSPNRKRLRNRINHTRRPLGPDHLNEMSYEEIEEELTQAGFEVLETRGFYLELFLNWWKKGAKLDYLQTFGNKPSNVRWMNVLNYLGQFFPRSALALIFIASKR